jgi:hypothetical protein
MIFLLYFGSNKILKLQNQFVAVGNLSIPDKVGSISGFIAKQLFDWVVLTRFGIKFVEIFKMRLFKAKALVWHVHACSSQYARATSVVISPALSEIFC